MGIHSILLTHAEVAVTLAGFASVAAVLRRPLSAVQRQRFLAILFASLIQILASVVPPWLSELGVVGPALWRIASVFLLVLSLVSFFSLIYGPLRRLGAHSFLVINLPFSFLGYGLLAAVYVLLGINLLAVSMPGFGLYYAALLAGLGGVFIGFADVVLTGDDKTS